MSAGRLRFDRKAKVLGFLEQPHGLCREIQWFDNDFDAGVPNRMAAWLFLSGGTDQVATPKGREVQYASIW